jgi:hypothetical protein
MRKKGIICVIISLLVLAILIAGCGETAGEATGKKTKGLLGSLKSGSVTKAKECSAPTFGCEGNQPIKISYQGSRCVKTIENVGAPCEAGDRCDAGTCVLGTPLPREDDAPAALLCTPRNYTVCNGSNFINVTQLANCSTINITTPCPYDCVDYPSGAVCMGEPRTTAETIRCAEGSKYACINSTHFLNATTNATCYVREQSVSCIALGFERCDTTTNWCV